jgi:lactoylglutathione lyase
MNNNTVLPAATFGYMVIYTENPVETMAFYEKALGLKRRFFMEQAGYGELETGATTLAISNIAIEQRARPFVKAGTLAQPGFGSHISFVVEDVAALYQNALAHGAEAIMPPTQTPWGQTEASIRDNNGGLVNIVSPRKA